MRYPRQGYAQRLFRAEQLLEQRLQDEVTPAELARAGASRCTTSQGLLEQDFRVLYGICPDDTDVTPEEHLRFDASVALPSGSPLKAAVDIGTTLVPAGTYAVGVHITYAQAGTPA